MAQKKKYQFCYFTNLEILILRSVKKCIIFCKVLLLNSNASILEISFWFRMCKKVAWAILFFNVFTETIIFSILFEISSPSYDSKKKQTYF